MNQSGARRRNQRGAVVLCVCTMLVTAAALTAQQPVPPISLRPLAGAPEQSAVSPAERRIRVARAALMRHPERVEIWNQLALALARRARETADPAHYKEAWTATERSLHFEPRNLEARKLQVWILLGQHEFPRAVEIAEAINREVPDDVLVYGFLVDGYVELGRYQEAERAAQWMLDMRPGNVPGLTRAAHLRELFGDHSGAVEFMDAAYRRTAESEVEDRAWILTHIAQLSLLTCRTDVADKLLADALVLFPDYHYALAQLAEVRVQQGRMADAVDLRERHYKAAPHPENHFELGVALNRAGRRGEAQSAWETFEHDARREMTSWDNANIELVYYYTDHANRPNEALAIARRESARRQDVRTLEALAWALHKNGLSRDALVEMNKALAVGIKHPVSLYRAGVIAAAAGAPGEARDYLDGSVAACGASAVADPARHLLRELAAHP